MDSFSMGTVKLVIKEETKEVHYRHIARENTEMRKQLKSSIISIDVLNLTLIFYFFSYFLIFHD